MKVLQFLRPLELLLAQGRLGREVAGCSRLPLAELMKSLGRLLQSPAGCGCCSPRVACRIPRPGCWGPRVGSDCFRRSRHKDGIRLWRWLDGRLKEAL